MSNVKIYGQKSGKCLLKVIKEGDNVYEPISDYISLTINKVKQSDVILNNLNNSNEIYLDGKNTSYKLSVGNIKENTTILYRIIQSFSYLQDDQTVCLIDDNNNITPINEGICIIEAVLYETNNYLETKTNQMVLSIYKQDQEDLQTRDFIEIDYQKSIKLVTLGGDNDAAEYEYTSSDSNICAIINDMLIARNVGRCTITAIKKGNLVFNDVKKEFQIKVRRINQKNLLFKNISFDNKLFVQPNYGNDLTITNIQENGKAFYIISDPNVCLIKNGKLFALSEGTCQIQGIVGETLNFLTTRTNSVTITITKNEQSELTITKSDELNFLSSISLTTIGGSTDNDVIYTTKNDTIKIVNYMIFGMKYGLARVTATIDGDIMYNPIKKEIDFLVNKIIQPNFKMQNINENNTLFVNPDVNNELTTYDVMENAKVKFVLVNTKDNNICNISSNTLIAINEGTCLVQAIALETANYLETKAEPILVTVNKNDQDPLIIEYDKTINFMETKYIKIYGGNSSVVPTLSYLENDSNCTIDGYQVYGQSTGVCPILVKKDTDFMYNSIEKTIFIEVLPISQQNIGITNLNELDEIEVDPSVIYNLSVDNIKENPKINYYILNQNPVIPGKVVCSFANESNNSIIPLNNGTFDIKAVVNMTDNYIQTETPLLNINVILKSAANYTVDKLKTLYFNSSIDITVNNGIFTDEYEIKSTEPNLVVSNNNIFGKKSGTYNVIISKKATFMFSALNKKLKINVLKINQPNFNFLGLDTTVYVEPTIGIKLNTSPVYESAVIRYVVVSEKATASNRVCNISNNMFYPYNEGTCIIKAITTETTNYLSTETSLITINVVKKKQSDLVISNVGELFYKSSTNININGGSIDSLISFTTNNNNCNVLLNRNTIEGLESGQTKIIVTKKGNFMYNDVSTNLTVLIKKINQVIKLEDVNSENLIYNENNVKIPLIVSGISENAPITFISLNPEICMISGKNLLTLSEGRCVIKAKTSETQNYLETETNKITIDIIKRNDNSFTIIPSGILYINSTIFLKIASPNKTSPISITSDNNKVTIDGFNIIGVSYGISNLTITQKSDGYYEDLFTNYIVQVKKIKQQITLENINANNMINVDDNQTYKLIVGNVKEEANVTFNIKSVDNVINNQIPCYIKNNQIFPFSEGTCLIEAVTDETPNFDTSKSNQITINIFKNQNLIELETQYTINFNSYIDLNKFGTDLIFVSSDNDNCTNVNNVLFGKKAGKYTVTYFKPADRLFFDLQKSFKLVVKKINQTAIFANINDKNTIFVNPKVTIPLVVNGIQENAGIYFNILGNGNQMCSIKNSQLTAINSGTCTIELYLTETTNYNATKLNSITISIIKNDQLPISIVINDNLNYLGSANINTLGGSTDVVPTFSSNDESVCKFINNTLIGTSARSTIINVFKQGNAMYNDISSNLLVKIEKIYQPRFTINRINNLNKIYVNPDVIYILTTSEVKEDAKVIYKIVNINSNEQICSINNDQLVPLLSGQCYIQAVSLENDNYLETESIPILVTIIKNQQSEIIIKYPTSINYTDSVHLEISGGNTDNIILTSIDTSNCIIDDTYLLTGTLCGPSNIVFSKEGNFMYEPINKTITIQTEKILQRNIIIQSLNQTNEIEVNTDVELELFVSNTNDNPNIVYEIVSFVPIKSNVTSVIKITDNKLVALNQGTVVIKARCLETFNYLETETPEFTIIVNLKNAVNYFIDTLPDLYFNSSIYLTISGSYDPNIYEIKSNNSNLNVETNKLTGLAAGYYVLTITKLATFEYKSLSKIVNINVYKLKQPSFSIINSNIALLVNPLQSMSIQTSITEETSNITYQIVSSISNSANPVCIINSKQLVPLNEGKIILKAISSETDNYLETESPLLTFVVSKNEQVPLNISLINDLFVKGFADLQIIGGSTNNDIIYFINNYNCYIDKNRIYGVTAGTSIIKCIKKGDFMYSDVTFILKINIYKIPQKIILNNINSESTLFAYASNNTNLICDGIMEFGNIRYKIIDSSANILNNTQFIPDVCKVVSGNKLISLNEGTCLIQGFVPETNNYLDTSSNIIKVNVIKNDIINISVIQSKVLYVNSSTELIINDSQDMDGITIVANNNNCTVTGNIINGLIAGTTILNIAKSDTDSYKGFNTQFYIKVNKIDQNVTIDTVGVNNELYVNQNVPVSINLIDLADYAKYKINIIESVNNDLDSSNNICTIIDNNLYVLGSGYCVLQAEIYETALYNSAVSNQVVVKLKKNSEKPIDANIVNSIYYLDSTPLDSLLGNSDNVVLYEVNNDNCIIINNVLIAKNTGSCTVKAYFEANNNYEGTMKYYNIQINKINQPNLILNNVNDNNKLFVNPGAIYNLIVNNINENAKYQYYLSDLDVCKLKGDSIIPVKEGICEIYFMTYETKNYLATKSNVITITITKNKQTNFYVMKSEELFFKGSTRILSTGGNTSSEVTYSSSYSNCQVFNDTVVGLSYGICTINALKEGNDMYEPINSTIDIVVNKIYQSNFILKDVDKLFVDPNIPIPLNISLPEENSLITFEIINGDNIITINNGNIYALNSGSCAIKAVANETLNYLETVSNTINITVVKKIQKDISIEYPEIIDFLSENQLQIYGGSTNNPFVFNYSNSNCSINENFSLKGLGFGDCDINISKDGNFMYEPIQKTINIRVNKIKQNNVNIELFNETNEIEVDPNSKYSLNVLNINENPFITFEIVKSVPDNSIIESLIEINTNILVPLNSGTVTLRATLSETNNYLETITPEIELTTILKSPNNYFIDKLNKLYFQSTILLTINDGQFTDEYTIESLGDNISVTENILSGLKCGQCNIKVTKKATFMYKSSSKKIKVTVHKIDQPIIKMLNLNYKPYVNSLNAITLETNNLLESAKPSYVIVNNNGLDGQLVVLSNDKFYPISSGDFKFYVLTSETDNYNSTMSSIFTVSIIKNNQSELFFNDLGKITINSITNLIITGGTTNNSIVFKTNNDSCYIQNSTLYAVNANVCKITATRLGDIKYNDVSKTISVIVHKIYQTVKLVDINNNNNTLTVNPFVENEMFIDGIKENASIAYNLVDIIGKKVCYINSNKKLIALNEGTCSIEGLLFETENYLSTKTNKLTINVLPLPQDVLLVKPSDILYYNTSVSLLTYGGSTNGNVTITTTSPNCDISGLIVTGLGYGLCNLIITKEGDSKYKPIKTNMEIKINKLKQNIRLLNINDLDQLIVNEEVYLNVDNIQENANINYIINQKDASNNSICYINNNKLSALNPGICSIQAVTNETNNYLSTKSNIINITIIKKEQALLTSLNINKINYGESINLQMIGGDTDADIEYTTSNSNCRIESSLLIGVYTGSCVIYAVKKGDSTHGDVKAEFNITVNKIYQKDLTISDINDKNTLFIDLNKTYDLTLSNIQENAGYNFYLTDSDVCNIVDDKLIISNVGTCDIYFETSETDNYLSTKSNTITITAIKNNQAPLMINQDPAVLSYKSSIKIYIDGGSTDEASIITSQDNNCQILNDTIIGLRHGLSKLNIFKPGNLMYNEINDSIVIEIAKINQPDFTLYDLNASNIIFVNPYVPFKLKTSNIEENATIIYEIKYPFGNDNSSIASINGNLLYANFSGQCTITAISLQTDNYLQTESNTITLNIVKNDQDNLIINYPSKINFNSSTYLETSGGNTENKIVFSVDNDSCLIDENNKLIGKKVGLSNITVSKEGNFMYNPISTIITIEVAKINQPNILIEDFNELNELVVDPSSKFYLNVINIQENATLTYQIIDSVSDNSNSTTVCTLEGNIIVPINSGYITVKAISSETTSYILTETPIFKIDVILNSPSNFSVDKIPQLFYNAKTTITINNTNFNIDDYDFSTNSKNISINKNVVSGLFVGQGIVMVTKKETFMYKALTKKIKINVHKNDQPNFQITDLSDNIFINPSTPLILTTSEISENAFINYKILSSNVIGSTGKACIISGNSLTTLNVGSFVLQAITTETDNYNPTTSPNITVNIIKNDQASISINATNSLMKGQISSISVDGGSSSNDIKYIINNGNCSIPDYNNIYAIFAGQSIITAIRPGNFIYNDVSSNIVISIQKITQQLRLLDINQYNNTVFANASISYDLILNDLQEKGAVTFVNNSNNDICIINNNKFVALKEGTCVIQAIMGETLNYKESKSNEISITINPLPQNDIFISFKPLFYNGTTDIIVSGGSSTLDPIITTDSNICTITGSTIYGTGIGKCLIKIVKPGNDNYSDIIKIVEIKVNKIKQTLLLNPISDDNNIYIDQNKNYQIKLDGVEENANTSFISSNSKICYVLENQLYAVSEGSVSIYAKTDETTSYLDTKSNKISINIFKQQTIVTAELINLNVDFNSKLELSPFDSTSSNERQIQYDTDSDNCKILNNIIIGLKSGHCKIKATLPNDNQFIEQVKNYSITINKIIQPNVSIALNDYNNFYYVNPNVGHIISISSLIENPDLNYTVTNNKMCKIENNLLYVLNEGNTNIYLNTTETDNYLSTKSNVLSLKFIKNNQADLKITESSILYYNGLAKLIVDGGSINTEPTISVDSSNCKVLSDNLILGLATGPCKINVLKAGNFMYNSIQSSINIVVNKTKQPDFKILDINSGNNIFINQFIPYKLSTTQLNENPIVLLKIISNNSNNEKIISIDGLNIYANLEGVCSVVAIAKETDNYSETYSSPLIITISKIKQDPIIINCPESIDYGNKVSLQTSGGNTDKQITFSFSNDVCTIDENNQIFGNKAGSCTITANKNGNDMYLPIGKIFKIQVNKIQQTDIIIKKLNELNEIQIDPTIGYKLNVLNANENPNIKYIVTQNIPDNKTISSTVYLNKDTLIATNEGMCTIKAVLNETQNYLQTETPSINININLKEPNDFIIDTLPIINFDSSFNITVNNGYYDINDYDIIPDNLDAFNINTNTLIPLISGYQKINIIKRSTDMYKELSKQITVKIMKVNQPLFDIIDISNNILIDLRRPSILKVPPVKELSNVTFNILSNNPNGNNGQVCKIDKNNIYAINMGSCLIQASSTETDNYLPSLSKIIKINVYKNDQVSLEIDDINILYYNSYINLSVFGGNTKYPIQIRPNNNNCQVNNNLLYGLSAGQTSVTLFKSGNNVYNDIKMNFNIIVYKIRQNITLMNINDTNEIKQNNYYELVLAGIKENSGYKFNIINTHSSNNDKICYFSDNKLYAINTGVVIIEVETNETDNYLSTKSNQIVVTILPVKQSDINIVPSGSLYYNSFITINVFGGSINSPVIIKTTDNNCLVADNKIYGKKAGKCLLTVTKQGNTKYDMIIKDFILNVQKIKQTPKIEIINIVNNIVYVDNTVGYFIKVSDIYENPKINYKLIDNYNNCCNIVDNKIYAVNEGYFILNAIIAETYNYLETITSNIKITVLKQDQREINVDQITNINYNESIMLYTEGGSSTADFNYDVSGQSCIVINGLLISKKAGTSQITISKKGLNNYNDISKQIIVKVNKIQQDEVLLEDINSNNNIFVNPNIKYNLSINGIKENAKYTIKLSDTDICAVVNNDVYGLSEGSCDIYIITDETDNYLATKSNIITIIVNKNNQAELDISLSTKLNYKASTEIYTTGGSNLEDPVLSLDNNNGKIVNNTIIGLQSGISELTAIKPGNFMYNPISTKLIFEVHKIPQSNFMLFNITDNNKIFVDPENPIQLRTSSVEENSTITYIVETENNSKRNVNINFGKLYSNFEGECFITAVTTETKNYLITKSNRVKVTVVRKEQNKLNITYPTNLNYNDIGYISVKGGNTNIPITLKSSDSKLVIDGNKVRGPVGQYTITVFKDGDLIYLPIKSDIIINIIQIYQNNIILKNINQTNEIIVDANNSYLLNIDNIDENADYNLVVVKSYPIDPTQKDVCIIQNNKLIALNIGYCIVKAVTTRTVNYLPTDSNQIKVTVILNDPAQFFIDTLANLNINTSVDLKINNTFDSNLFSIKNNSDGLKIVNNSITGIKAGQFNISVTKLKTNTTNELTKNVNIIVNKIDQPNFIIDISNNYFINPNKPLNIKLPTLNDNPHISLELTLNNPVGEYDDDVCRIINREIYALNKGSCMIKVISQETENYNKTESIITLNILRNIQNNLNFVFKNNLFVYSTSFLNHTGGSTTNEIRYMNEDNKTYLENDKIYGLSVGISSITAYLKGNQIYETISSQIKIPVYKTQQIIKLYPINGNNTIIYKQNLGYKIFIPNIKEDAYIKYTVSGSGRIENNLFYPFSSGTCSITATTMETDNYLETTTNTQNIIIKSSVDDVLDLKLLGPIKYNSSVSYNLINNNSKQSVKFINKSDKIAIKDNKIFGLKAGKCLLTAYKSDISNNFIQKDFAFTILKVPQTVTLQNININNTVYVDISNGINLIMSGVNENPSVNYIIKKLSGFNKDISYIKDNKLYAINEGLFYISIKLGETQNYLSTITNKLLVTVIKTNINDIKLNSTNTLNLNESIDIKLSYNDVNLFSNNDNCTIVNNVLIANKPGTCIVTANKDSTQTNNKFIRDYIIKVNKGLQQGVTMNNINSNNNIYVGDSMLLSTINVKDNANIIYRIASSFNSNNNNVCIIQDNNLIAINEGICNIYAVINETNNYQEFNTPKIIITVLKKNQNPITLTNNININYNDNIKLIGYGGNNEYELTYRSDNNNCNIINNVLIGANSGTCNISAIKKGDSTYKDITKTVSVVINKILQPNLKIVGLDDNTITIDRNNGYDLYLDGSLENTSVTFEIYNSSNKDICKIDKLNKLFALKEGICYIRGITTETTNYLKTKSPPIKVTVIKKDQNDISFVNLSQLNFNGSITLDISGSTIDTSGNVLDTPVKYSLIDSSNCLIINNIIYGKESGMCIVKAYKEGNDLYYPTETTMQIDVNKIRQPNFKLNQLNLVKVNKDPYLLTTSNINENPIVFFRILTSVNTKNQPESIVLIVNNKLYAVKSGICIIQAVTTETNNYLSTRSNEIIITVLPANISTSSQDILTLKPVSIPMELSNTTLQDLINAGLPASLIPTVQQIVASGISLSSENSIQQLLDAGITKSVLSNIIQIFNKAVPIPISSMPIPYVLPIDTIQKIIESGIPVTAISTIQQLIASGIPLSSPSIINQLSSLGITNDSINNLQKILINSPTIPISSAPAPTQLSTQTLQQIVNSGIPLSAIPIIQQLILSGIKIDSPTGIKQLNNIGLTQNLINILLQIITKTPPVPIDTLPHTLQLSNDTVQLISNINVSPSSIQIIQQLISIGISLSSPIAIQQLNSIGLSATQINSIQQIVNTAQLVKSPITYVTTPSNLANIALSSLPIPINSLKAPVYSLAPGSQQFSAPVYSLAPGSQQFSAPVYSLAPGSQQFSAPVYSLAPGSQQFSAPVYSLAAGSQQFSAPMSSEPILVGTFISSSQSPIVPAKKDNTALLKKLKLILLLKQLQAKKAAAAKQKAADLAKAAALAKAASSAELKPAIASSKPAISSSKPAIVSSKPALILTKPALVKVSPTVAGQPVKTVTIQKTGPTNKTLLANALAKVLAKKK
jgi:hypothetical protein